MGKGSAIEWTDHTFNPWWGCIRVSPGCEHCYAETFAKRVGQKVWGPPKTTERRLFGEKHWAEPVHWNAAAAKAGVRARVFCASMADVFEDHPALDAERAKLWPLIERTPWLDWQILTKRPENIQGMVPLSWRPFPSNVWLGVSVEDQQRADARIPYLLGVPVSIRFLSCEPLLGPVDLSPHLWRPIPTSEIPGWAMNDGCTNGRERTGLLHWAIVGGESGPGARPTNEAWVRQIVTDCRDAGVAPFVKQMGRSYYRDRAGQRERVVPNDAKGGDWNEWPEDLRVREMPRALTPNSEVKP